jgi:hypothetical protein
VRAGIAVAILQYLLFPTPCRADEPSGSPPECREAFEEADLDLRPVPEPHLLRARELLRKCASSTCQPWMIAACTHSLTEVERRIPTVVLIARASGRPIIEAGVQDGGRWLTHRLDGRSVEVEPGERELVLKLPSGLEVRKRFVVEEGARLQRLDFDVPESAAPSVELQGPVAPPAAPSRAPRWLGTAGVIATAAGLGTLALGTTFGVVAWNARDSANCDARGLCDPEPLDRANSASTVSTVGFAVGGALLGLGLAALGISVWAKAPAQAH